MLPAVGCKEEAHLAAPRCEYQTSPINIDTPQPRFSWEYNAADDMQQSYNLEVARDEAFSDVLYSSGEVASQAQMARYNGPALESHSKYYWRVSVKMAGGKSLTSDVQSFETAAMPGYEWAGQWISDGADKDCAPAPMLRKSFNVREGLQQARLYISAAAYYKLEVNGKAVDSLDLAPDYTDYAKRSLYNTYDLTADLATGENVLAATLGNGFYNCIGEVATWKFESAPWRGRARMIAELHLSYADGTREIVATDPSWKCATGPSLSNNIYTGEIYDARLEIPGWSAPGFDDSAWQNAVAVEGVQAVLASQQNPGVSTEAVLDAVRMRKFSDTLYVFDFGKNISGMSTLTLAAADAGIKITMRHGELLKADGRLEMGNIALYTYEKPDCLSQTDIYYTKEGAQTFTPSFTYHGFQYVEVSSSAPIDLTQESLKARFYHTGVQSVGSFSCSDTLVNQIYEACRLSYLDNLVSIPTDCPHREKNGWTADANLAIDLALLGWDGIKFYEKWIADMADAQNAEGNVPGIVPTSGWGYEDWIGPVWATAYFMIPDALLHYYGDKTAVESIFDTCDRYLDYLSRRLDADGTVTYGIGDWVYYNTATPTDYSTSLFYYWQNVLMTRFAALIGRDGSKYAGKAEFLKDLINRKHFDAEKCLYGNGSQAGQGMALMFDIVPAEYKDKVVSNLNQMIVDNGYFLDFGSVGSKFVPRVLADNGYAETVFKMMTKREVPSWGAWVAQGRTTLGETWGFDAEKFRDGSQNHVFLGDIAAWMVKYLAGIRYEMTPDGACSLTFEPCIVDELDWAGAEYKSVRGLIRSRWERRGGEVVLTIEVPANARAKVIFGGSETEVGGGLHEFTAKV